MKNKIRKIIAIVVAILVLAFIVGGLIWAAILVAKAKAWPLYFFLAILLLFGWGDIAYLHKWVVKTIKDKDEWVKQ